MKFFNRRPKVSDPYHLDRGQVENVIRNADSICADSQMVKEIMLRTGRSQSDEELVIKALDLIQSMESLCDEMEAVIGYDTDAKEGWM